MKMLFYTADPEEVKLASEQFARAEIPCEIRHSPVLKVLPDVPACAELWIRNDKDCHRAFMLCVQLGIGFSRRNHSRRAEDLLIPTHAPAEPQAKAA
jgi:hypothetical protein